MQFNLPQDREYTILESWYSSIVDGGGTCCENCGKPISNIALIQDKDTLQKYHVGLDCAETLSGIKDDGTFEFEHKARFNEAKSMRARILKAQKNKNIRVTAEPHKDKENCFGETGGGLINFYDIERGGSTWKNIRKEVWEKYLIPMIKDLIKINQ